MWPSAHSLFRHRSVQYQLRSRTRKSQGELSWLGQCFWMPELLRICRYHVQVQVKKYCCFFALQSRLSHLIFQCCRTSLYIGFTGLYVYYLQLEVTGKVVGNFDLVMSISSQSSSTRIIYKAPGQTNLQNIDAASSFCNIVRRYSGDVFRSAQLHLRNATAANILLWIQS